jgi:hypothetical protein
MNENKYRLLALLKKASKYIIPYQFVPMFQHFFICRGMRHRVLKNLAPLPAISKPSPRFIVSLTSYGKRVGTKAPIAIMSILQQSYKPDMIVLWLAHGTKVPKSLKKLQGYGLEIKYCDDLRSYKKLIPSLIEFPADVIITADDDICYREDWLEKLRTAYIPAPHKIHCHAAHEVCVDKDKNILPYKEWRKYIRKIERSERIFPVGAGGILYPPNIFKDDIMDADRFQRLSPFADDIWFWAMAKCSGVEHSIVDNPINNPDHVGIDDDGLAEVNVTQGKNDDQLKAVISEYPEVYNNLLGASEI